MDIKRDLYLQELKNKQGNGLIKVVTGIRRCGKSYLLFNIFYDYLIKSGVKKNHIIKMQLDDLKNKKYRKAEVLMDYIENQIKDNDIYYILLDEVQMLEEFEEVLNSLLHIKNTDIYVTGSNSKFLSKDIITEFRGRGDEIHIFPLSFSEFMSVYKGDKYDGWNEYLTYGGLPMILSMKTDKDKSNYLNHLFKETYIKDIVERNNIKGEAELEELINILSSSIGSLTNPTKLYNTFKSIKNVDISQQTIINYLSYLEDAFLINKAMRYDVKGKRYIATPQKYYFEDVGLRNARLNFRQQEHNHIMENIIYNELRYRGYNVDVGVVDVRVKDKDGNYSKTKLEIDFVANQGSKKYYIQSAFRLSDEEKTYQEQRPLISIRDSFKKIIIVGEKIKLNRDEQGIVVIDIFDFLLNPNSLDL